VKTKEEKKVVIADKERLPYNRLEEIVRLIKKAIPKAAERESLKGKSLAGLVDEAMAKLPEKPKKQAGGIQGVYERQAEIHDFRSAVKSVYTAAAEKYPDLFTGEVESGLPVLKPEVEKMAEDILSPHSVETEDGITNELMQTPEDMARLLEHIAGMIRKESQGNE